MPQFIKKLALLALGTVIIGTITQAQAASYLYCTDKEGSYRGWADEFEIKDKVIPDEWKESVHFIPTSGTKGYIYLYGWSNGVSTYGMHPLLDVGQWINFRVRDERGHFSREASLDKAKRFCDYLKSFCPENLPYVEASGGNLSLSWWSHIYMSWSEFASDQYVCPNWQYH
jgi:hypothetical protein